MKLNLNLFSLLLVFVLFSCKKENTFTEYKYSNKGDAIICNNINSKLYSEALFSFENDIINFYQKEKQNLALAYSQFIRASIGNRAKYETIVSPHTIKVFEALKNESDLWDNNNTKSHINYNGTLINCISENIKNNALKTTFNSLLTTNSMSPKLIGTPLLSSYRTIPNDKYLATYIAFDLFYTNLFNIDFSAMNLEKVETKVDFNKVPQ